MSSPIEFITKETKRKLARGLTVIDWDDDTMSVADQYASSKKFRRYVLDTTMPNDVKVWTDKLERDIEELEEVITNIADMLAR
jgi:hypothetical protein